MMRGIAVILVIAWAGPTAAQVAGLRNTILDLTGNKRLKIVWCRNTDPAGVPVYGGANVFKLMGYDTQDDTIRVIKGELDDYSRPVITSDGERIVYTDRVESKIYVVNWNGSNRRLVVGGPGRRDTGTTWYDSASDIEWVYFEEGEESADDYLREGEVWRINLDPPGQLELVWDQIFAGFGFLAISSDGARLAGSFPWPDSGAIEPYYDGSGDGVIYHPPTGYYGGGCWPTITPDTRYFVGIFNRSSDGLGYGGHRGWKIWDCPTCPRRQLDLYHVPGNEAGWEIFHPRMSNHPQFVTVTGPYTNGTLGQNNILAGGPQVEVYLGKVNAGFSLVTDWVQITTDGLADAYPHAWVASEETPQVQIDAFTATQGVIVEGGNSTLSWATRNATSVSIDQGIDDVNASGSRVVSPAADTTYTLTALGEGGPKTRPVEVKVVSMTLPLSINCGDGSPAVAGWLDESVFRTGGAEYDFSGAVDLNGQQDPAPASVYLTCVHTDHSYTFPVPDGTYTVRLHFYDGNGSPGRAMDYTLEGIKMLDDFDIAAEAGGWGKALVREFTVVVSDGDGLQIVADQDGGSDVFESGIEILEGGIADTEDPVVAITSPTSGETLSGNVTTQGTTSDNVAVARVEVSLDGGAWEQAEGTTAWSHTLSRLAFVDGSHTIGVRATDPAGNQGVAEVSITTNNTPSISVVSPSGGESWQAGSTQHVEWITENCQEVEVWFSVDGGDTYRNLVPSMADNHPDWGNWPWVVPNEGTDRARILIHQYNQSSVRDESGLFSIVAVGNPAIELSSPVGGETLAGNSSHTIAFEATDVDTVVVEYSSDGGESYEAIATQSAGEPGWGTVVWTVPNVATTVARVRARTPSGDVADTSGDFTIEPKAVTAGALEVLRTTFQGVVPREVGKLEVVQAGGKSAPVAEDGSFEVAVEVPAGVSQVTFAIEGAGSKGSYRRLVRVEIEDAEPPIPGLSVSAKELREFVGGRSGVLVWVDAGKRIQVLDFREESPELRLLSEDLNCVNPLLSPDGTRVVYSQGQPNGPKFIVARALAGGAARQIGTGDVGYWGMAGEDDAIVTCDWSDGLQDGAGGSTYRQKLAPDGLTPEGDRTELHDRAMDAGPSGDGAWLGHVYKHLYAYNLASGVEYPTEKFFLMGDGGVADHQTCNGSMAPDGSGRLMCLVIPHDFVRVYSYRTDGDRFEQSSEFRLPAGMAEWGFPEWSTHPQFFTAVLRTSDLKSRLFVVKMAQGDIVPELLKITGKETGVSYSHLYLEP